MASAETNRRRGHIFSELAIRDQAAAAYDRAATEFDAECKHQEADECREYAKEQRMLQQDASRFKKRRKADV